MNCEGLNDIMKNKFTLICDLIKLGRLGFLTSKFICLLRFNFICFFRTLNFKMCFISKHVVISNFRAIKFGTCVRIDSFSVIDGAGGNGLILKDNVSIGPFSRVIVSSTLNNPGTGITLSKNVGIGSHSNIGGSGGVFIGKDTIIGPYFSAHPENHNFSALNTPIRLQGTTRSSIFIGEDCWIGAKVTILSGVKVGNGCVIAAGSVVNKNVDNNMIVAGVPAKIIGKRNGL